MVAAVVAVVVVVVGVVVVAVAGVVAGVVVVVVVVVAVLAVVAVLRRLRRSGCRKQEESPESAGAFRDKVSFPVRQVRGPGSSGTTGSPRTVRLPGPRAMFLSWIGFRAIKASWLRV